MKIAVIGMGYVGLPLAMVFAQAGAEVVGIEALPERCAQINAGSSYIDDVPSADLAKFVAKGLVRATPDYAATEDCDADIICLPTPLNANREPDLTLVKDGARRADPAPAARPARDPREHDVSRAPPAHELAPILEAGSGLKAGVDFFVAYLAGARRPGAHRLHHAQHPQGRRRSHAGLLGAGG